MHKDSNLYISIYTAALTIICGAILGFASEGLKPFKEANIAYDLKKNILSTTMDVSTKDKAEVEKLYDQLVKASYVVNAKGEKTDKSVASINTMEEYSLKRNDPEARLLPVYELASPENPEKTSYYVFPVYGFGLWDYIWGYIALEADLNTIKGAVFAHKGETAGLGARIVTEEVRNRFVGKKIFEGNQLVSVFIQKGEGNNYDADAHKIDGMSGATLTGKGVNTMLSEYFGIYKSFIEKHNKNKLSLAK